VVCFTDDDCRPEPEWAARLQRALGAGADAAGGKTVSGGPGDPFAGATEVIIEHLRWSDGDADRIAFAPSNNLASSRSLLLRLPFDETYPRASAEDRDWCARVLRDGGSIVVVPEAVVHHFPSTGIVAFWRQNVRYGRGAYQLARRREPRPGLQPPSFYARLLRGGLSRGLRCGVLVAVAQMATAVGFVNEAWTLRRRRVGRF
jgi:cellulose synthase/poly-beta-1,6-N-acetylglucosamine synthase-like glycosyltransferase